MFWVKIAFVSLLEPNFYTLPVLMLWYFHMNMVAYIISYGSTALSFIGFDVVTFKSEQLWLFTRKSHMIEIINTASWMRRKHRKQRHVNDIQLLGNGDFLSVLVNHKLPRLLKITLIKVNSLKKSMFQKIDVCGWREGSVIKSTYCSYEESEFDSHPNLCTHSNSSPWKSRNNFPITSITVDQAVKMDITAWICKTINMRTHKWCRSRW